MKIATTSPNRLITFRVVDLVAFGIASRQAYGLPGPAPPGPPGRDRGMSGPGVGTRHEGLTSEGNVDQGWAAGEQPWEAWPELLAGTAREILGEIRAGHPEGAVNLLDGLLADLEARRRTLAELANEEG